MRATQKCDFYVSPVATGCLKRFCLTICQSYQREVCATKVPQKNPTKLERRGPLADLQRRTASHCNHISASLPTLSPPPHNTQPGIHSPPPIRNNSRRSLVASSSYRRATLLPGARQSAHTSLGGICRISFSALAALSLTDMSS